MDPSLLFEAGFTSDVTLEQLRIAMSEFAAARDWQQYHTPRNLLLALTGEMGELAELFQWEGEVKPGLPGWSDDKKTHLGEELADVLLYLIRLSARCGVDLPAATLRKMELNAKKYPVDKSKGSSAKYTEYNTESAPTPAPAIAKD